MTKDGGSAFIGDGGSGGMTRSLAFRLGITIPVMMLASCATTFTTQRCEQAAAGLNAASQIAAVLVNAGIETAKAEKLAQLVATGQLLLSVACAQANPVAG